MVAGGMVPMKPLIQLCALYQISVTENEELRNKAESTVTRMPATTLKQLADQPLLPVVLDWLSQLFATNELMVRSILLNRQTDSETVLSITKNASEAVCELVAQNQTRLLSTPELIEALYFNPMARASTVDRVLDFAARNRLDLPNIPDYQELVAEIRRDLGEEDEEELAAKDAAFRQAQDALKELETSRTAAEKEVADKSASSRKAADLFSNEVTEEVEGNSKSAAGRIRDLNIAQRVRLAMMGSASDRAILIRDTNKLVARSVIRSPAVTDSEVLHYSKNKSLLDEVIGFIANNRKWTRHYQVKMNLVMNPKTPTADALRFLTHLRLSDLRLVSKSRDVPGPIAKAAKNMVKTRSH